MTFLLNSGSGLVAIVDSTGNSHVIPEGLSRFAGLITAYVVGYNLTNLRSSLGAI